MDTTGYLLVLLGFLAGCDRGVPPQPPPVEVVQVEEPEPPKYEWTAEKRAEAEAIFAEIEQILQDSHLYQPGERAVVTSEEFAFDSRRDIEKYWVLLNDDMQASVKFLSRGLDAGSIRRIEEGTRIQVVESDGLYMKIRPQGDPDSYWVTLGGFRRPSSTDQQ